MTPLFLASAFVEILLVLLVLAVMITIASIFIIRDLRQMFKGVFKIRSRFHIELRKLTNLMSNILKHEKLEPFTNVVIKNLPHEQKRILITVIDDIYETLDKENADYKYIYETYENLQTLRRERDAKILIYNQKLRTFPFNVYARIMKLYTYELYTEKN